MRNNPLLMIDGYKSSHRQLYPKGTTLVYSNYTCRSTKYMPPSAQDIVVFGVQYMIKYIHELWRDEFFNQPKDEVCGEAKKFLSSYLMTDYDVSHFEALHDLGFLPIEIKGLDEGTVIGKGIPLFTIKNTNPEFFWVTNFLETLLSTLIWKPVHSASIAYAFRKILTQYAIETGVPLDFIDFQGHDFSFRGMQAPESAISSGMGFLTSFKGTDTIPAVQAIKHYYSDENAGFSVPASEHSIMCAHGKDDELGTFEYAMNQFPSGIVSLVSDTWNIWNVLTKYLPQLKDKIMARDGKLVIRPDSGDPADILCGTVIWERKDYERALELGTWEENSREEKGVVELLWEVFGGTINEQGYKVLDPHIGVIQGDGVTLDRAVEIAERLKAKGFANQVVYGMGSYQLGLASRDNQGGAVKATYVEVNGEGREIFKDPITDDGTKKSAKGLLAVEYNKDGKIQLVDQVNWFVENQGLLKIRYKDGEFFNETTLTEIRERLK